MEQGSAGARRVLAAALLAATGLTSLAWATEPAPAAPEPPHAKPADPLTARGQAELLAKGRLGRQHTVSPLIVPDQFIPLRFSHRLHLGDLGCTDCHQDIEGSIRSSDDNLPTEEGCFDCHDVKAARSEPPGDPPSTCDTCHPGYQPTFPEGVDPTQTHRALVHPPAVVLPPPNLAFNHKVHLSQEPPIGCDVCHGDMTQVDFATRENSLPLMETCLGCHNFGAMGRAPSKCATCHLTRPDGRIDTMAAGVPLKPQGWYNGDAHDDGFLMNHKHVAKPDKDGYCESCHTPSFCMDCHNGVTKPLSFHPNNWVLQHPIAARKNTPECSSCHRSQTFCVDCHQQTRVAWENGGKDELRAQGLRFHPEGWVDSRFFEGIKARGPNHHSFHAQRNIRACASCHTEQTCLTCHAPGFGALAVSPHPPGFGGSGLCRRMLQRNHRACVKCHSLGSGAIEMCR